MLYFYLGALALAACAAWTDFRTGHIPNQLTLPGLVIAVVAHAVYGGSTQGMEGALREGGLALGGALVCGLAPLFMHLRGGMGGGDVKLFASLGAMLHPLAALEAETYAFVAAAVLALASLARSGRLLHTLGNTLALVANPLRKKHAKREVPSEMQVWFRLGPAIFMGTATTFVIHLFSLRGAP
jgi:prepilin peptidase CpaA